MLYKHNGHRVNHTREGAGKLKTCELGNSKNFMHVRTEVIYLQSSLILALMADGSLGVACIESS